MPPKITITKQKILDTAFNIIRTEGYKALTTRNIAHKIGCSTQPIYRIFGNIKSLETEILDNVLEYINEYTLNSSKTLNTSGDLNETLKLMGLAQLSLMEEEPLLYEFIFSSKKLIFEKSYELLDKFIEHEVFYIHPQLKDISKEDLKIIFKRTWVFLHGYISLMGIDKVIKIKKEILLEIKEATFPSFAWNLLKNKKVDLDTLLKWEKELNLQNEVQK